MNHSRQRDLVLQFLKGTNSHPTAEEVYEAVCKTEPNISLGTVYRNLNLLAETNSILKLHMQDGLDHFDADTSEHYHLYCNSCNRVYDLDWKPPKNIFKTLKISTEEFESQIDGCTLYFYGKCFDCKKSKPEKSVSRTVS